MINKKNKSHGDLVSSITTAGDQPDGCFFLISVHKSKGELSTMDWGVKNKEGIIHALQAFESGLKDNDILDFVTESKELFMEAEIRIRSNIYRSTKLN